MQALTQQVLRLYGIGFAVILGQYLEQFSHMIITVLPNTVLSQVLSSCSVRSARVGGISGHLQGNFPYTSATLLIKDVDLP